MADRNQKKERDFLSMQQEAINRVREMQARARQTLENAGVPLDHPETARQTDPAEHHQSEMDVDEIASSAKQDDQKGEENQESTSLFEKKDHQDQGEGNTHFPFHLNLDTEQIMLMALIYV
ncbi:MAG TPA: hypothetical protein DEP42_04805, partial [Ruminococcaceae bacterium]|nr:hypothetical protein [Oscillospiraceae bacterium]